MNEWMNDHQVLYGKTTNEVRWRECVSYVNSNMESAVGSLYVKKAFSRGSKNMVGAGLPVVRGSCRDASRDHKTRWPCDSELPRGGLWPQQ